MLQTLRLYQDESYLRLISFRDFDETLLDGFNRVVEGHLDFIRVTERNVNASEYNEFTLSHTIIWTVV